jgi:hypothetical protein
MGTVSVNEANMRACQQQGRHRGEPAEVEGRCTGLLGGKKFYVVLNNSSNNNIL